MSCCAVTCAIGTLRIAPAEARIAFGENGSAQPGSRATPASKAAASRTIVPTLPGSCTPSSAATSLSAAKRKGGRWKRPRMPCEVFVSETARSSSSGKARSRPTTMIGVHPAAMASSTIFGPSSTISPACSRTASRTRLNQGFCRLVTLFIYDATPAMILKSSALSAIWTFPSILISAFVIAWGAEAAQFLISQGLALAILAWLQTLPEFAVEAVIAWNAGKDPSQTHLAIANFTGSLRLLVGLGWPMIYFVAAAFGWKRQRRFVTLELDREHSVEVFGLLLPILYFVFIWWKGSLALWDAFPLMAFYFLYLFVLWKIPPKEETEESLEDLGTVPRKILSLEPRMRNAAIWACFISGGLILYFSAHPFLNSMLAIASTMGISTFVFVQWVAPFLSEFPEKISAFYWARKV